MVETATEDLRQCHGDHDHEHDTRRREVTVGRRAAAAGGVQRPREASMPRGEGVYGSSADQSGKATGRVQGRGQGDPSLHPAASLLGFGSTANQRCRRACQSSVLGRDTSDTIASFEETRYCALAAWPTGCSAQRHRIVWLFPPLAAHKCGHPCVNQIFLMPGPCGTRAKGGGDGSRLDDHERE